MSSSCNGICNKYHKSARYGKGRYLNGQKRCNVCEIFVEWDGLWCPCCNNRLRLSPRSSKNKAKFLEIKSQNKEKFVHGL